MKIKNIVLFFLIGYFVAMLLSKWLTNKKDKKKITLLGIVGGVATASQYPNLSALCGGLALYETGEEAGLSFNSSPRTESKELGKIKDDSLAYETNLKLGDYDMQVFVSKWFEPYEYVETADTKNYILRPTIWKYVKDDYEEKGVYFIREKASKNIIYIGKSGAYAKSTSKPRQSFDRLYRHFQKHDPIMDVKAINHPPFDKEDYEVRVVQVFYPTREKIKALEIYYNQKYKPFYSYGQFMDDLFAEEEPDPLKDKDASWYNNAPNNLGEEVPF